MSKKKSILVLLVLAGMNCPSQIRINQVNQKVSTEVSILHIEPEQPVEGMPVIVYFRFTNRGSAPLTGWIGAEIHSGSGAPGVSQVDWEVKDLPPNQYTDGAVFVRAPDAGLNRLTRVFYYAIKKLENGQISKSSPQYGIGEYTINISALLRFRLETFRINHTRARTTDTNYGSLYVSLNDQPVMQPASSFLGDCRDGTHEFNKNESMYTAAMIKTFGNSGGSQFPVVNQVFDSGPFAVVPGVNATVKITYFIYNGGSITNTEEFLKGFAEATANQGLLNGPRPGRAAWFDIMRVLCPPLNIIGACDGFVVADSMLIQTNDLFNISGNGNVSFNRKFNSEEFASQIGCGSTSDYDVYSKISRLSNPGADVISPIYSSVTANRTLQISGTGFHNRPVTWQKMETISADGAFITVTDPAYGYVSGDKYHAPPGIKKPLLVIVRGTSPQTVINSNTYSVFSGSSFKNVTAIIQLIPGTQMNNIRAKQPYQRGAYQ